jgi:hypothetical protein
MKDWFACEHPVAGLAISLTVVALLVLAGLAACTHSRGTDGTPSAAEPARPGSAAGLEPYPLIPLRKDLGEFLIEGEQAYVQQALGSVEKVIKFRMTDPDIRSTRIGAGNHRGDHGTPHGCFPAEFLVQRQDPQGERRFRGRRHDQDQAGHCASRRSGLRDPRLQPVAWAQGASAPRQLEPSAAGRVPEQRMREARDLPGVTLSRSACPAIATLARALAPGACGRVETETRPDRETGGPYGS